MLSLTASDVVVTLSQDFDLGDGPVSSVSLPTTEYFEADNPTPLYYCNNFQMADGGIYLLGGQFFIPLHLIVSVTSS